MSPAALCALPRFQPARRTEDVAACFPRKKPRFACAAASWLSCGRCSAACLPAGVGARSMPPRHAHHSLFSSNPRRGQPRYPEASPSLHQCGYRTAHGRKPHKPESIPLGFLSPTLMLCQGCGHQNRTRSPK